MLGARELSSFGKWQVLIRGARSLKRRRTVHLCLAGVPGFSCSIGRFAHNAPCSLLFKTVWSPGTLVKGERGKAWKGEDPQENWEKGQVLWICRGVGVVPSRVMGDEYRI